MDFYLCVILYDMKTVEVPLKSSTLAEKHTDFTRELIVRASINLLEQQSVGELTARGVAMVAGISERTIFRYFATRAELLNAVAAAVIKEMKTPPPPKNIEELLQAPAILFSAFEAKARLTKAALHTELFDRIRETSAQDRWIAVQRLIDELAPHLPKRRRKVIATNIRYFLSATSWHYYRFYFGFTIKETIECAETAIQQALASCREEQCGKAGRHAGQ